MNTDAERDLRLEAIAAHARGDREGERIALDKLALMEREIQWWRSIAESATGERTPDALERWIALSGLSINLHGGYGEWGCQALEMLFAELGIQPGDDFETAVQHARADAVQRSGMCAACESLDIGDDCPCPCHE